MVALLVITVGSLLLNILPLRSSIGDDTDPGYIILAGFADRSQVTALNPITLQDEQLPGVAAVGTPSSAPADLQERARTNATNWYTYQGGEALLRVDTSDNSRLVTTWDGITGQRLAEFDVGTPVFARGLSDDGRYLVLSTMAMGTSPDTWFVVDPTDGRLMATMSISEPAVTFGWDAHVDPVGRRLYRLVPQADGSRSTAQAAPLPGPSPVVLVGYDITTGKEIGRLPLPHLLLGNWPTDQQAPWGGDVQQSLRTDLAVSSDGRRVALFDPRGERITLIDARTFSVVQEVTVDPILRSAMATPIVAATPAPPTRPPFRTGGPFAGVSWTAAFAADGQALYIGGSETAFVAGQQATRDLGFHRIDLVTGRVTASATGSATSSRVMVAGDAVFTYGSRLTNGGREGGFGGYVLRRLDPETLTERAARDILLGTEFIILKR